MTSEPATYDQELLRSLLRNGGEETISGPIDTRAAVLDAIGTDERSAT